MILPDRYEYCQRAIQLKQDIEQSFLTLAEYLYRIKQESLWEECYDSWEEFCAEIRLSNSTIHKLISIYSTFVLEYGVSTEALAKTGGWSVLAEALPLIHSKSDAGAWVLKATLLSLRDMRKEVLEAKTGVSEVVCKHEDANIITLKICPDCGLRERVYE